MSTRSDTRARTRRPTGSHPLRGIALILLASVFFGSSGAIGKPAMQAGLSPEQVAGARIVLAAVILLLTTALLRPAWLRVSAGQWRLLIAYGLLGVAGVQMFYFIAASRVPVGVAILLEFTSPVLIALWVRLVRRQILPRPMWAGIALAMAGLALVCELTNGISLDGVGLAAGLASAVCSAAYFLLGEHGVHTMHPVGVVTWGMTVGAMAMCVLAPPWRLPADVLTAPADFGPWQPPVAVLLVAVAVVSTVLAYVTGITALRYLPASVASVLGLCEPIAATTMAWALLSETMTSVQVIGTAVLLTGAALVQAYSPDKQPAVTPEPMPESPDDPSDGRQP